MYVCVYINASVLICIHVSEHTYSVFELFEGAIKARIPLLWRKPLVINDQFTIQYTCIICNMHVSMIEHYVYLDIHKFHLHI